MYKKSGRSFVTIMIVVALSALFLRIAIEKIIKFSIAQNESTASLTLKLISTALENYAKDNRGVYPPQVSTLTRTSPAYLDKDYIAQSPFKGYHYSCSRLDASGYSCSALPLKCKLTGNLNYTVSTGGLLISEDCGRKE